MPPKKKGGKKGKKGGKKSAKDDGGSVSGEKTGKGSQELNELSKEFFLIQVKDLEQRLSRYQKKCDELSISNAEYEEKYKQVVQDRKEIVDFLKKQLEQRQDEISDLHDRLLGLQQAKDVEKENSETQLSQFKRESQDLKDTLISENMILSGKIAALEEFRVQKENLMQKFADMEANLKQQETDHNNTIYELERKAVVDKDRLKKEMVLRVNNVAAEFRKVSNKQMADTTKRNIRENVSINSQLAKMSEKTKELVQENDELREKEKKQKMQIELLEATQEELAKKNHSNLKVLKMITARARQQEVLLEELETREQEYVQFEEESGEVRTENEQLHNTLESLEEQCSSLKEQLKKTEKQNCDVIAAKERLEDILAAAAYTLKQATMETNYDDPSVAVKRETMMDRLLLVLDSAALLGKAPPPADFFKQRAKTLMAPLASVKEVPKQDTSRVESPPKFPHYKLGDLGLVPRPRKQAMGHPSKVAHLSATTRIGLKPSMTIGSLTPSTLQKHDRLPAIVETAK
uniref:Cilia- and flagella-associated protein 157 n=1 Tax=Ciona intestinalis TaxID=7719 RepID=F6QPP6_CIOIN|nr:cilia- and flagella-associated protein 157 [Ciona intestinalis]|eukprot:XP_002123434.1 cilia- and flagella-associated protein 157 [Ciona intestinalis]